ncbi:MAG: hypothetical protein AB7S26_04615 [Sandaracinaceae bacterium]
MSAPLRRPSPRSTVALSVVALAIAGGALASIAVAPMLEQLYASSVDPGMHTVPFYVEALLYDSAIVAATTATLLALALALALRSKKTAAWTILLCVLFGWLNAPAFFLTRALVVADRTGRVSLSDLPSALLIMLLIGLIPGAGLGFLYGFTAAFATVDLRDLLDRPSFALRLEAQRIVGLIVLVAASIGLLARVRFAEHIPWAIPWTVAGLGLLLYVQARVRRTRMVALTKNPTAHGYERVPLDELGIDRDAVWPLHGEVSVDAAYVLVKRAPESGRGGYRSASVRIPIALVD